MDETQQNTTRHTENTGLVGNTKTTSRARKWCLTLNNWSEEEYNEIHYYLRHKKHTLYIIGKELGAKKTPHLQIYFNSKNPVSFQTLKNLNDRLHLEKAKGSDKQNYEYCSKEGNYITNMKEDTKIEILKEYDNIIWKDWQQKIIDIIEGPRDPRTIYWFLDEAGNNGKSFLSLYLYCKYNVALCGGKSSDMFNIIKNRIDEGNEPDVILLDLPRSFDSQYVAYTGMEKFKDRLFVSGKYEGGDVLFRRHPHMIVLSNEKPIDGKFTPGRCIVIDIHTLEEIDLLGCV